MERKAKFEMNTISILGIIFFCMGIVFMAWDWVYCFVSRRNGVGFSMVLRRYRAFIFVNWYRIFANNGKEEGHPYPAIAVRKLYFGRNIGGNIKL